jgi:hypothetical protein
MITAHTTGATKIILIKPDCQKIIIKFIQHKMDGSLGLAP